MTGLIGDKTLVNSETTGLFKYLAPSEEKLFFFESSSVMGTPPLYLNDPWDFLPTTAQFTVQEIEQLSGNNPNLTSSELVAKYPQFFQREKAKYAGSFRLRKSPCVG